MRKLLAAVLDLLGELLVGMLQAGAVTGEDVDTDADDEADEGCVGNVAALPVVKRGKRTCRATRRLRMPPTMLAVRETGRRMAMKTIQSRGKG